MTIRKKIILSFVALAALCLVTGIVGIVGQAEGERNIDHLLDHDVVTLQNVNQMALDNLLLRRYEKDFLLNIGRSDKQKTYREKYVRVNADMDKVVAALTEQVHADLELAGTIGPRVKACREKLDHYRKGTLSVFDKVEKDPGITPQQGNALMDEFKSSTHAMEALIDSISTAIVTDFYNGQKIIRVAGRGRLVLTLLVVIVAVALAIGLGIVVGKSIVKPILMIAGVVRRMGRGDFSETIDTALIKRTDEMGAIATAAEALSVHMHKIIGSISGNATTVAASATELSATSTQIAANTVAMSAQTGLVMEKTAEVTESVSSVNSAAIQMSEASEGVAAAIEEMSVSLSEVAKNCQEELRITSDAGKHVISAQEIMERLGNASKSIGNVIDIINNIAEQTNLLALNATIEAASAGEAGKGFSVVASEVKELARQTALATGEIGTKIEEMQANSEASVAAITLVAKVIADVTAISHTIVSAVEEQSATINEIAKNVSVFNTNTQHVAGTISKSAGGLREVSQAIGGVRDGAAETARGVATVRTSAQELAKLSEHLNKLVSEFTM